VYDTRDNITAIKTGCSLPETMTLENDKAAWQQTIRLNSSHGL